MEINIRADTFEVIDVVLERKVRGLATGTHKFK